MSESINLPVGFPLRFGRKPWERRALARAFVGKAVYNHPTTCATIEALKASPVFRRLCGFVRRADIPSESTFSRAFAEFAQPGLGERVHAALVEEWVKPELVGHISRDATAIQGREKPLAKPQPAKPAPRKKGRPRRGEVREPKLIKPDVRFSRIRLTGDRSAQGIRWELMTFSTQVDQPLRPQRLIPRWSWQAFKPAPAILQRKRATQRAALRFIFCLY
ncbi:MAG: transposase [Deltaproteobacteria bacterium]|nr:transposase [Deltaproteobacteria bacterium]